MAGPAKYPDFVSIGPGTPTGEFLRRFWQPVFESAKLTKGRSRPLRVLGEDFTMYRGQNGEAHIMDSRCPHRSAKLALGRVEGDNIACLYHGWTFDGSGQCLAQPAEPRPFSATVKIRSYPVQEYVGFIFAYFGPGEPPPFQRIATAEADVLLDARESRRPYPFFSQLENSVDEAHFNFTHRVSTFTDVGLNDIVPEIDCKETDYGIIRYGKRGESTRVSHILMPNCLYSKVHDELLGWTEHFSWRVPIDDATHSSFVARKSFLVKDEDIAAYESRRKEARKLLEGLEPVEAVVERILSGEMHLDEMPYRPDQVMIQDLVVLKSQGTRPPRDKDQLGASDKQIRMLRQIYGRELQAIADGGATKQWRTPFELTTSTGL